MSGICGDCDFNEEIMKNMETRIALLEERLKEAEKLIETAYTEPAVKFIDKRIEYMERYNVGE